MRQINLNLNSIKGIVSQLKGSEKQAEKAVDKIVEQAVEKAVEQVKQNEEAPLIKTDIKLDTVEIRAKIEKEAKAAVEAVSPKGEDKSANNNLKTPFLGALTAKTEPIIFAANDSAILNQIGKKGAVGNIVVNNTQEVGEVVSLPRANGIVAAKTGGGFNIMAFDNLVAQWNRLDFNTATYDQKLALMDNIIRAAENEGKDKEAKTWKCYRFTMKYNYAKSRFMDFRAQLQNGVAYDDLNFLPEDHQYDATGHMLDYEDFADFKEFGGTVNDADGLIYTPNPNNIERYIYTNAMLAVYTTKMVAIQVKLKNPHLTPSSRDILNRNMSYFRFLLSKITSVLAETRENLQNGIIELPDNIQEPGSIDIDSLLIPGLTPPPAAQGGSLVQFEPPEDYTALCVNYKGNPDKNKLMELILFVNNKLRDCQNKQERAFWQTELARWQTILDSWGNTTAAGNSSRPPVGNGGRGTSPNSEINKVDTVKASINIFAPTSSGKSQLLSFDEVGLSDSVFGANGHDALEENEEIPEKSDFNKLLEKYNTSQEEYKQDSLKILLNFVCKMIAKNEDNNDMFWRNQFKALITEWDSHGWERFVPEYGLERPW